MRYSRKCIQSVIIVKACLVGLLSALKTGDKTTPSGIPVSGPAHSERNMRAGEFCHYSIIVTIVVYFAKADSTKYLLQAL